MHVWTFSDDDLTNYRRVRHVLCEAGPDERWPDVKIVLLYTGRGHATESPQAEVLIARGITRAPRAGELDLDVLRAVT